MGVKQAIPSPGQPARGVPPGLFRDSPLALAVVDARTRIIFDANDAFGRLVEHAPANLVGESLEALDRSTTSDISEYLVLALAARDRGPRRRTLTTASGSEIPVEIVATRLEDGEGTLVLLSARDVRKERKAEKERNRLQAQLLMAQKHEAIGRLAAGVAHDFSNLLSVVILTAELLKDRLAGDIDALEELEGIIDAGFRARSLTVDLVAFAGKQVMELRPVSLNEVILEMEDLLRRTLPEDVELALRLCPGQAAVKADPTQLQQVLLNLVVNARDAMPGGGYLAIATREVEVDEALAREYASIEPGPHVMLSVTDTGVGMDPETRARIFEPFFSTRERGRGEGLGLSTVYGIVKQSGGSIWASSEPGAGTTIKVYLPRLAGAPRRRLGRRGTGGRAIPGGNEHVLVVEDEESVRLQTAKILGGLGYEVTQAASADEALDVFEALRSGQADKEVELVVTDIVMPGLSGVELARRLREGGEDVPVLFVSGYPVDKTASKQYLPKPFTQEELAHAVRRALRA